MLSQIREWVLSLSALTGLDDWLLSGGLFAAVVWTAKHAGLVLLRRVAGEHLPIGETGQGLLDKLEEPDWTAIKRKDQRGIFRGKVLISPDEGIITVSDRDAKPYLNRREQRLIFTAAREVRAAVALAQTHADGKAINADLA